MAVLFLGVMRLVGERPLAVARQVMGPVLLAFATPVFGGGDPSHIEQLERMGVPKRIIAVVLPLSYSFNLDGPRSISERP